MPELAEYLAFAERLAREAGEIARTHFVRSTALEPKGDMRPVTAASLAISNLVIKSCREAYPEIGVIGETESDNPSPGRLAWVCDPIDGTIPYSLGMYISTFCLALVQDGEPVVGVVYDFGKDVLFSAVKDGEPMVNGVPMPKPVSAPTRLVNLEWWGAGKSDLRGLREHLFAQDFQILNYASPSYLSMMAALGRTMGVIYSGDKPWDVAAAKVIIEACGGKVTDLYGDRQRFDKPIRGAIIAGPDYFEELLHAVSETLIHGK